jgi:hypothetical protein
VAENSDDSALEPAGSPNARPPRRRGPGRPFKPGQSGNPGGISKRAGEQIAEAKRLGASAAPYAMRRLHQLSRSKDERVSLAAAVAILDRVGLRPFSTEPERLEVTHAVDLEALRAKLVERARALAGVPPGHSPLLELEASTVEAERPPPAPPAAERDANPPPVGPDPHHPQERP